ncbi:hypothetical protein G7Y41_07715 [Schaalia sp. ZJ405]|uniref:hypothetical protein n=1 Tax=Schaalia sp. ZJ405 TaxID=2709403 RepID=UPI0013ECABA5|nr:hypothetical protein [Schaalia sp. ZJ405]QPK80927.1 hypothetical protein G7Y41_07715 [Schaalia sp. ZJ405]
MTDVFVVAHGNLDAPPQFLVRQDQVKGAPMQSSPGEHSVRAAQVASIAGSLATTQYGA